MLLFLYKKFRCVSKFSSKNETFLNFSSNLQERWGGTKNVVVVVVVVVVPFFFIHFLLFQHNSRDSARPSASLRSEKFTKYFPYENLLNIFCCKKIYLPAGVTGSHQGYNVIDIPPYRYPPPLFFRKFRGRGGGIYRVIP